jgi:hypothetical protein
MFDVTFVLRKGLSVRYLIDIDIIFRSKGGTRSPVLHVYIAVFVRNAANLTTKNLLCKSCFFITKANLLKSPMKNIDWFRLCQLRKLMKTSFLRGPKKVA